MDLGLSNRVALVAGSSSGLGFATALELAREGARVVLNGRDAERLAAARRRLIDALRAEGEASAVDEEAVATIAADVATPEGCARLVEAATTRFGRLDVLVTNAGGPPTGRFDDLGEAEWSGAFELTLMSAVRLVRAALPLLRESDAAAILTITSISLKQPIEGLLLSNAMRPAVAGLTKTLSQELAGEGIRVNSLLPGWTATERVVHIFEDRAARSGADVAAETSRVTDAIPLGRMAEPAEIGRVAAFLCSPAAGYVSGVMLQVDGGSYPGLL